MNRKHCAFVLLGITSVIFAGLILASLKFYRSFPVSASTDLRINESESIKLDKFVTQLPETHENITANSTMNSVLQNVDNENVDIHQDEKIKDDTEEDNSHEIKDVNDRKEIPAQEEKAKPRQGAITEYLTKYCSSKQHSLDFEKYLSYCSSGWALSEIAEESSTENGEGVIDSQTVAIDGRLTR